MCAQGEAGQPWRLFGSPARGRRGGLTGPVSTGIAGAGRSSCSLARVRSPGPWTLSTRPGSLCCPASLHSCPKPGSISAHGHSLHPAACSVRKPRCKHSSAVLRSHPHTPTGNRKLLLALPCMYTSANRQTESAIDRAAQRPLHKHPPHVAAGQGQHIRRHPVKMRSARDHLHASGQTLAWGVAKSGLCTQEGSTRRRLVGTEEQGEKAPRFLSLLLAVTHSFMERQEKERNRSVIATQKKHF